MQNMPTFKSLVVGAESESGFLPVCCNTHRRKSPEIPVVSRLRAIAGERLHPIPIISQFSKLRKLDLAENKISRIDGLERLVELEFLALNQCAIDDGVFPTLKKMTKLQSIVLANSSITGVGFQNLSTLESLREVDVSFCRLSNEGMRELFSSSQIRDLWLVECNIRDGDLPFLCKNMQQLEKLHLTCTRITDRNLVHLSLLRNLKELSIYDTGVTEHGLRRLQMMLPPTVKIGWAARSNKKRCDWSAPVGVPP
jgi:hypothetical protein